MSDKPPPYPYIRNVYNSIGRRFQLSSRVRFLPPVVWYSYAIPTSALMRGFYREEAGWSSIMFLIMLLNFAKKNYADLDPALFNRPFRHLHMSSKNYVKLSYKEVTNKENKQTLKH